MPVWVDWDRQPVSVHGDDRGELEALISHLKSQHNLRKRSLVMDDRENGGFLFFFINHVTALDCCIFGAKRVDEPWVNDRTSRYRLARSQLLLFWSASRIQETLGAICRSMLNYGFDDLRLVEPRCSPTDGDTRARAKHAARILDELSVHDTIHDATSDCSTVVGTSESAR